MNVLETKGFPQHNIAGLISGITVIVLFQSGEASTVEGNKHTHTHTKSGKQYKWQSKNTFQFSLQGGTVFIQLCFLGASALSTCDGRRKKGLCRRSFPIFLSDSFACVYACFMCVMCIMRVICICCTIFVFNLLDRLL